MSKLSIFIVEDSPLMLGALKQLVVQLGHTVAGTAESYNEAVIKLTHTPVDMVISDIMLRGRKNGIDLGAYIKSNLNVPLIYQSSLTDQSVIDSAMLTSPLAYLVKPVTKADLESLLTVEVA